MKNYKLLPFITFLTVMSFNVQANIEDTKAEILNLYSQSGKFVTQTEKAEKIAKRAYSLISYLHRNKLADADIFALQAKMYKEGWFTQVLSGNRNSYIKQSQYLVDRSLALDPSNTLGLLIKSDLIKNGLHKESPVKNRKHKRNSELALKLLEKASKGNTSFKTFVPVVYKNIGNMYLFTDKGRIEQNRFLAGKAFKEAISSNKGGVIPINGIKTLCKYDRKTCKAFNLCGIGGAFCFQLEVKKKPLYWK